MSEPDAAADGLVLLGTGAADGWPQAFCDCDSCAAERSAGRIRGQSAALLDGHVLIDCGPSTPEAAERLGISLRDVDTILYTHGHSDHFSPAVLMHRSWVTDAPLTVVAPADVVAAARDWLPDDAPIDWITARIGDEFEVAGAGVGGVGSVGVSVLASSHRTRLGGSDVAGSEPDAVIYAMRGRTMSLLYACDTGPLPDSTLDALAGRRLDLAVIEETFGDRLDLAGTGHHHIESVIADVERLRSRDALGPDARVVLTHLSHHNPPTPDLARRVAPHRIDVPPDGHHLQ